MQHTCEPLRLCLGARLTVAEQAGEDTLSLFLLHFIPPWRSARNCVLVNGGDITSRMGYKVCAVSWLGEAEFWCFFYKSILEESVDEQCIVASLKQFIKYARSKLV